MLVSHSHKFIFIKTEKTASTSTELYLERYCSDSYREDRKVEVPSVDSGGIIGARGRGVSNQEWWNHMPAQMIKDKMYKIDKNIWNNYIKISTIRDPFDSVISLFWFEMDKNNRKKFFDKEDEAVQEFRKWAINARFPSNEDQLFLKGNVHAVDVLIRYEHLLSDLESVCARLGIPFEPERLARAKSGLRPDWPVSAYYDMASAKRVSRQFRHYFSHFGYEPQLPAARAVSSRGFWQLGGLRDIVDRLLPGHQPR